MRFLDKVRELITGDALVTVPDNCSPEEQAMKDVREMKENMGYRAVDTSSIRCCICGKWVFMSDYSQHICK